MNGTVPTRRPRHSRCHHVIHPNLVDEDELLEDALLEVGGERFALLDDVGPVALPRLLRDVFFVRPAR